MPAQEIIPSGIATEATLVEVKNLADAMLYFATAVLDKLPRLDNADRAAVVVESGVAVTSLPTLATVTTVATTTNLTNLNNFSGGNTNAIPYNLSDAGLTRIYNGIVVT
jgi:hypothetical protein